MERMEPSSPAQAPVQVVCLSSSHNCEEETTQCDDGQDDHDKLHAAFKRTNKK